MPTVIKAERVDTDERGEITTIYCTYDPDTLGCDPADGRKVKGVIHWVSVEKSLKAEVRLYDRLFKVENPNGIDLEEAINGDSLKVISAFVEPSLSNAEVGVAVQFERTGYFCKDPDSSASKLVFNRTVGLRDTWSTGNN